MTRILIIIFLFLKFLSSRHVTCGQYKSFNEGSRLSILNLNPDSSFVADNYDCTYQFKSIGRWTTKQDTIKLIIEKVYHDKGNKNLVLIMDTTNANYRLAHSMTKYLVRRKKLILLYQDVSWSKLIRQK